MTWLRSLPPGSVIVDRQPVLLDTDTPGGRYPLTIRIFDRAAGTYLSVLGEDGAPGPDSVSVGEVKVLTPEGPWVGAAPRAIVGDLIEVIGYDLDPVDGVLRPGDDLTVTIVYRVSHAADRELTAFTHVYSSESGLVAQHDAPPLEGNNPSTSWVPGEVIRDVITLTLDPSSPPGPYQVMWGLYDPATGERLPLTLTDGVQPSERALMLQEIEIAGR